MKELLKSWKNALDNISQPATQPETSRSVEDMPLCAQNKRAFEHADLVECGMGKLFGKGNAQLPLPPMLMFDRIAEIAKEGGKFSRGTMTAELAVTPDLWFFACHFHQDPVMPGCLGLDALWQLLGFHLAWLGHKGRGRALGVENIRFREQVLPSAKRVFYELHIKRVISGKLVMGIADGELQVDGATSMSAKGLRVGLFR